MPEIESEKSILHIVVARKPVEGTVSENCLKYGCGAINIDRCRVALGADEDVEKLNARSGGHRGFDADGYVGGSGNKPLPAGCDLSKGRWPANLILDGSAEVFVGFPHTKSGQLTQKTKARGWNGNSGKQKWDGMSGDSGSAARFFFNFNEQESIE